MNTQSTTLPQSASIDGIEKRRRDLPQRQNLDACALGRIAIRESVIIVTMAVVIACTSALVSPKPTEAAQASAVTSSYEGVLWVDARPDSAYTEEHIPGALNLNQHNWDAALGTLFETWQPPQRIAVYCSAGCDASQQVADRLLDMGLEAVEVFEGGYERWKEGQP